MIFVNNAFSLVESTYGIHGSNNAPLAPPLTGCNSGLILANSISSRTFNVSFYPHMVFIIFSHKFFSQHIGSNMYQIFENCIQVTYPPPATSMLSPIVSSYMNGF